MLARIQSTTSVTLPGKLGLNTDCQKLFPASCNARRPRKSASTFSKIYCMNTWEPVSKRKFETLSYLPPLSQDAIVKQVDYMIHKGWIPCLEFAEVGDIHRTNSRIPRYYDGRYWTMWKLPMFGCTDAKQVMDELNECKETVSNLRIRIIGFDKERQVQCMAFVVYKPN